LHSPAQQQHCCRPQPCRPIRTSGRTCAPTWCLNDKGEAVAINVEWIFDEGYTAAAIEGMDANGDGIYTSVELHPVVTENIAALKEFRYFVQAKAAGKDIEYGDVTEYLQRINDQGRLQMIFVVPFAKPVNIKTTELTYQIYDPDFFIAYEFVKERPVAVIGDMPKGCSASVGNVEFDEQVEQTTADAGRQANRLATGTANRFRLAVRPESHPDLQTGGKLSRCPYLTCSFAGPDGAAERSIVAVPAQAQSARGNPPLKPVHKLDKPSLKERVQEQVKKVKPGQLLLQRRKAATEGADDGPAFFDDPRGWIQARQRAFYSKMSGALTRMKRESAWTAAWTLMLLSFCMACCMPPAPAMARRWCLPGCWRMSASCGAACLSRSWQPRCRRMTAIVLVTGLLLSVKAAAKTAKSMAIGLEAASFGLIALTGLWLVWQAVRPRLAPAPALAHAGSHVATWPRSSP
jgi:ABC-type uncharacterized transport system substrate-binding protein